MAGIYIHIPFCERKCAYCDFLSFVCENDVKEVYVESLVKEINLVNLTNVDSIYIGGGTPTALSAKQLEKVLVAIRNKFVIAKNAVITVEANPNSLSLDIAKIIGKYANRVSLGAQCMQNDVLKTIGRLHLAEDVIAALKLLKFVGIDNINVDLMYALPGQKMHHLLNSIELLAPYVSHFSAYSLILEEGTPLFEDINSNKIEQIDADLAEQMHFAVVEKMRDIGFLRYEVSNYAKPGYECAHNVNYWEYGEYQSCGLGASSQMHVNGSTVRTMNTKSLKKYTNVINLECRPFDDVEYITAAERDFEYYMMGLRQVKGAKRIESSLDGCIDELIEKRILIEDNNRIRIACDMFDRQNIVLQELMEFAKKG